MLVPLLLYTTPLLVVHACEAWFDDVLVVPRLPVGVRYSIYVATVYLTLLFGNFGGAEFIYFQFCACPRSCTVGFERARPRTARIHGVRWMV